jgi:hypothetical protein
VTDEVKLPAEIALLIRNKPWLHGGRIGTFDLREQRGMALRSESAIRGSDIDYLEGVLKFARELLCEYQGTPPGGPEREFMPPRP